MEDSAIHPYLAGFVAVMGRPNVGKSTLINSLLGQKIAAVSPRPQTTRRRQLGILTLENAQIIFVDTPGVHHPHHKLGETMVDEAKEALEECDLVLFLVDASQDPDEEDRLLADLLKGLKRRPPVILVINKSDLISDSLLSIRQEAYSKSISSAATLAVSATRDRNLDDLLKMILSYLPESAPLFPEGQITDLFEREISADLIREATLYYLKDEIPHGITVRVDEYTERNEHGAFIAATIFVERENHKPIVIGQGGKMLKQIGSYARKEIETMNGRKVFLQLRVKVRKNWRNDERSLKQFGFGRK